MDRKVRLTIEVVTVRGDNKGDILFYPWHSAVETARKTSLVGAAAARCRGLTGKIQCRNMDERVCQGSMVWPMLVRTGWSEYQ